MPRIEYTSYQFTRPALPSEHSYGLLKKILLQNPSHSLNPKSSIKEAFLPELNSFLRSMGIGILVFLLGVFISVWERIEIFKWISGLFFVVSGLILLGAFFWIFRLILSFASFMAFRLEKWSYYHSLKKDLIKTNTYEEFLRRRKNK